jgi:iron complex outermembrane recepter protein
MRCLFQFYCGFPYLVSLVTDDAALRGREPRASSAQDRRGRHCKRRRRLGAVVLCLLATMPLDASRAAERVFDIDIPAMNAAEALNRLAEQTGSVMLFPYDLARTRQANSVRGRYTLLEGLELLLRNTGLSGGLSDKRVVIIVQSEGVPEGKGAVVKKRGLLAGIIAVLAGTPTVDAAAQQATGAEQPPTGLSEVLVTAQRRQERLLEVPISMSVLSGSDLDRSRVEGVTEALNLVPGVATTVAFFGGTNLMVRGVTASSPTFAGSSPIAYYLDSVPFGLVNTAIVPDANAYDLDRVEVLRGPQGTLYGASAQNGVVRVLTTDADMGGFDLKARGLMSGTDGGEENYRGDLAINIPLIDDKLAARAVIGHQNLSGWIDRPNESKANDAEINSYRLKVNAQPTDKFSIGLSAWASRADYGAPSNANDDGTHSAQLSEPITIDYNVYGLTLGYEARTFSISSTTGYLDYTNSNVQDFGPFVGVPLALFTDLDADVLSEEVLVNSNLDGPWRWSVGGIYRDGEDRLRQNNLGGGAPFDYANGSESYAFFGEVARRFLDDRLEWTIGARYFHDDVFVKENISQGPPGSAPLNTRDSFDATTPRVVLTWRAAEDLNVYGSYSQGFRSGFPQSPAVMRAFPTFPAAEPDELHNYEIGLKASRADGRLTVESAIYYIDWQDVQQLLVVPAIGTIVASVVNGAGASGVGVDFALACEPLDGLTIEVNVGWNDLTMDEDVFSLGTLVFEEGDRLNLSPETTAGASVDYAFPLSGGGLQGRLSASAHYMSEQSSTNMLIGVRTFGVGDSLVVGRLSAVLESRNHWTATLFVDNFNNEDGAVARNVILPIPDWSPRIRPRTIGVQFEYRH